MKKNIVLKTAIFLLSMAVVSGIYTFIVIPSVKKEEKAIYEKKLETEMYTYISVLTYTGDTPLLENTIITEAVKACFEKVQMPLGCATSDYVSDFDDICGMQLKYAICNGQQVSYNNFKEFLKDADGSERLKEFPISSLVAGQAMPGRYADILLKYPDGSSAVVVPKIQIYDIQQESEGNITGNKKDVKAYTMVFAVNEEEYNDLIEAIKEGVLEIRIYIDELQVASEKTYIPASFVR
ncbi:MAG: hypothetical protein IKJ59_03840 [Clostridia bacterium]|nr:hypothetical protein [Clostridia bacterium]